MEEQVSGIQMSKDDLRNQMFQIMGACNEMEEHKDRPIELKESKTETGLDRGLGLFATRDIEEGEWLTTFPVRWVVMVTEENRQFGCAPEKTRVLGWTRKCYGGETDFEELIKSGFLNELSGYSMGILQDLTIIADPQFKNDNRLFGHFINDLSFIPFEEYDEDKCNCGFKVLDIHSKRKILKGEELSICYSKQYWDEKRDDKESRRDEIQSGLQINID